MKDNDKTHTASPPSRWWIWLGLWAVFYFGYTLYFQVGWFFRQPVQPEQAGLFVHSSFVKHTAMMFLGSCIPATAILATEIYIPVSQIRRIAIRSVDLFWYPFGLLAAIMAIFATQDQQLYARFEQSKRTLGELTSRADEALERSQFACKKTEEFPLFFRSGGFVIGTNEQHFSVSKYCDALEKGSYSDIWADLVRKSIEANNLPPAPIQIDTQAFYQSLTEMCPIALGQHTDENGRYAPNKYEKVITGFTNTNLMQLNPKPGELVRVFVISRDLLAICDAVILVENQRNTVKWYENKYSDGRKPLHPWFWVQILALLAGLKVAKSIAELVQTWREGAGQIK